MGAGIKEEFSSVFACDVIGVVTGSFAAGQFPNLPCGMARFKAWGSNAGTSLLGTTLGQELFPLAPGNDTGWFAAANLNRFTHSKGSGSSDMIAYWLQK